eukprot:scaffold21743_cov144-Skeletonema_dohrnii-CCMP3373.AAC.20
MKVGLRTPSLNPSRSVKKLRSSFRSWAVYMVEVEKKAIASVDEGRSLGRCHLPLRLRSIGFNTEMANSSVGYCRLMPRHEDAYEDVQQGCQVMLPECYFFNPILKLKAECMLSIF